MAGGAGGGAGVGGATAGVGGAVEIAGATADGFSSGWGSLATFGFIALGFAAMVSFHWMSRHRYSRNFSQGQRFSGSSGVDVQCPALHCSLRSGWNWFGSRPICTSSTIVSKGILLFAVCLVGVPLKMDPPWSDRYHSGQLPSVPGAARISESLGLGRLCILFSVTRRALITSLRS